MKLIFGFESVLGSKEGV